MVFGGAVALELPAGAAEASATEPGDQIRFEPQLDAAPADRESSDRPRRIANRTIAIEMAATLAPAIISTK